MGDIERLPTDGNSEQLQVLTLPNAGSSVTVTTVVGVASVILAEGVYRVLPSVNVALAVGAGSAADLPLRANISEVFFIPAGNVSVSATLVGTCVFSLAP